MADLLSQWQTIPVLSRPHHLAVIERAIRYGDDREKFVALKALATQNYGFALFERIEAAKRALSDQTAAHITLQAEEIDLAAKLTRREFNRLIQDEFAEVRSGVREAVARAGLAADAVDTVVTTGGSSMIPAFQELLRREFSAAQLIRSDTFGSVSSGLALCTRAYAAD
jgi:hypothetical chaperone protein